VLNSPGTIDCDYRGEVQVLLINLGSAPYVVRRGERIAQIIVGSVKSACLEPAQTLAATHRGKGGFGSTGAASMQTKKARSKRKPLPVKRRPRLA
jgi:dUTP pyrophosphatase